MKQTNPCKIKHYQSGKGSKPVKYNKELYDINYNNIKWKSKRKRK